MQRRHPIFEESECKWCSAGMKEAPFYYPGITLEEYEKERTYFQKHIEEWQSGTYEPLWQQTNNHVTTRQQEPATKG